MKQGRFGDRIEETNIQRTPFHQNGVQFRFHLRVFDGSILLKTDFHRWIIEFNIERWENRGKIQEIAKNRSHDTARINCNLK